MSLSSFTVKTAQGNCPYVGVPAFVSRAFRHTSIYVRTDRIKKPADLKGKKVGVPEYQLTANVWARAILEDDHGVKPSDIHWIRGGIEEAGRRGEDRDHAAEGRDARERAGGPHAVQHAGSRRDRRLHRPARAVLLRARAPNIGWLFADPVAAAKDYFKRTGIFPIMHLVGVRRELAEQHPWLPGAVLKAFERAKTIALEKLSDTSSTKVTLPFVEERLMEARALMGDDFWSYGVEAEPQDAGDLPAPPSCARFVVAAAQAGGAVPPGHARDVQALSSDWKAPMKGLSGFVAFSVAMGISMSVSATEIHVMSGGAPQDVFALLTPKFEQQTGNKVKFTFAVITALARETRRRGEGRRAGDAGAAARWARQGRQAARRQRAQPSAPSGSAWW